MSDNSQLITDKVKLSSALKLISKIKNYEIKQKCRRDNIPDF